MSTQYDLGPVMMVPKGNWDAAITYERLNLVRYGSTAWVCIVDTSVGVEPGEESTDWTILAKDTSSVTSVNGMEGDVVIELTETETPPADDNSNRIATTEWVTDKLGDVDLSGIKDDTILAAQNASSLEVGTGELTSAELVAFIVDSTDVAKNSVPTGTIITFAANAEPPGGYLLCNGAVISRTTYATLYAAIGDIYGAGDGLTTFNLPDTTDRFIQGNITAGTVIDAGLPNIKGSMEVGWGAIRPSNVILNNIYYPHPNSAAGFKTLAGENVSGWYNVLSSDASRASSIYGNSDTVQPPALTMRCYIKY